MPPAIPMPGGETQPAERKVSAQAGFARPLLLVLIALGLALPILAVHPAPLREQSIPFLWCGRHPGEPHCH
jgi:hypothetical protein